jgi:hypothetical protein
MIRGFSDLNNVQLAIASPERGENWTMENFSPFFLLASSKSSKLQF